MQMASARELLKRLLSPWALACGSRRDGIRRELAFWDGWMGSRGGQWPEEFLARTDPATPFPARLHPWLEQLPGPAIDVLDVGSGPLTSLGRVHPRLQVRLVATDPLAVEYNRLLSRHGIIAPVPAVACEAEALAGCFAAGSFDVIHARNSLDHARDPLAAVAAMGRLARSGGVVILDHESDEGVREGYRGLHRWNFAVDQGCLGVRGAWGRRRDVATVLPGFRCIAVDGAAGRAFAVYRKTGPAETP